MSSNLSLDSRFKLGFFINTAFMLLEYAAGLWSGSLILIADASHNLTDSVTLAISWLGDRFAKKPADETHTLGHGRITVLAAFINSSVLVAVALLIFLEAYRRFTHPASLDGTVIGLIGFIGILANGTVASLFRKDRDDINVKAAYTNMAFDTVFSAAALVAGLLIALTHQTWIDPAISIGVGIGLLYAALGILLQATNIFLEGVPKDLDLGEIRHVILKNKNVKAVTDLYAWAISSNEYVLSCSIVPRGMSYEQLTALTGQLKKELGELGFAKVIIEVT